MISKEHQEIKIQRIVGLLYGLKTTLEFHFKGYALDEKQTLKAIQDAIDLLQEGRK